MASESGSHAAHWPDGQPPTSFGNLYPKGDIIAPAPDLSTAEAIADQLRGSGFGEGDVVVFDADAAVRTSEELERRRGVLGRLGAIFGDEHDVAEEFAHFARDGFAFVVVHAPNDEAVARARTVLRANGVTHARHYGHVVVTDL